MLWTGALLNPTGPLEIGGDWPEAPDLPHLVAYAPLGVALMPVWSDPRIAYTGLLEDGSTIPGMWKPVDRMPDFPTGVFEREEMPPFLSRWPDDWAPRNHWRMGAAQPTGPQATSTDQQGPASSRNQGDAPALMPHGPRQSPTVRWGAVAGMAWIRPDPGNHPWSVSLVGSARSPRHDMGAPQA